jgi:hypothetical protein
VAIFFFATDKGTLIRPKKLEHFSLDLMQAYYLWTKGVVCPEQEDLNFTPLN